MDPAQQTTVENTPFPKLLFEDDKAYEDIVGLLKHGVQIDVIANVKGCSVEELMAFMHLKSIERPNGMPQPELEVPKDTGDDESYIPVGDEEDSEKRTEKKKRRSGWKGTDFPLQKDGEYHCADCKMANTSYHCRGCKRKCWRYCEKCAMDTNEQSYYSNHHSCFQNSSKKKRRRAWKQKDFPLENLGAYYCLDCQKSTVKRACRCGRSAWQFCNSCSGYRSKHHFPCEGETIEEEEEMLIEEEATETEPALKKRKV